MSDELIKGIIMGLVLGFLFGLGINVRLTIKTNDVQQLDKNWEDREEERRLR